MEYYSSSGLLEELVGMEHYRNEGWNVVDDDDYKSNSWLEDSMGMGMGMGMDESPNSLPFYCDDYLSPPAPCFSSDSSNTNQTCTLPHNSIFPHQHAPPTFHFHTAPPSKLEPEPEPAFNTHNTKLLKNKLNAQPSKNLMAERRRRKRLNDRLSMLRSVVPKISKMDRTSILGDTIDYMKELFDSINKLQQEMNLGGNVDQSLGLTIFNKPQEMLIRNSPKFEVERKNSETRIEICCGGRAGLLVSTVTTLEALGIDIQHCVISCFNDFAMQASCSLSQDVKQRAVLDSEDIKQALFRNAGYGGRCV